MQIRADQLPAALAKGLRPLYVIHGDEPLLAQEAADAVRAAARSAGYTERSVNTVRIPSVICAATNTGATSASRRKSGHDRACRKTITADVVVTMPTTTPNARCNMWSCCTAAAGQ